MLNSLEGLEFAFICISINMLSYPTANRKDATGNYKYNSFDDCNKQIIL